MKQLEPVFPSDFFERDGCLNGPGLRDQTVQYTFTPVRVLALVRSPRALRSCYPQVPISLTHTFTLFFVSLVSKKIFKLFA